MGLGPGIVYPHRRAASSLASSPPGAANYRYAVPVQQSSLWPTMRRVSVVLTDADSGAQVRFDYTSNTSEAADSEATSPRSSC
jgi:hypothetical protein